jgi:pyruvate ferredoxin oxidoreductase gamma subunit
MIKIVICSRGGQGGVKIKESILESAMEKYLNSHGFSEYGAERRGAPVAVFMYIAKEGELVPNCQIEESDCLVFFGASLLGNRKFTKVVSKLKKHGLLIINSSKEPSYFNDAFKGRKATIDATQIALDEGIGDPTTPIVNTTMAGAIVKMFGFNFELLCESFKEIFGKGAEINIQAAQRGYDEVRYDE